MCGLVGVIGDVTTKAEQIFEQLMIVDSLRGMHSTGVVVVNGDQVNIAKEIGDPFVLMGTDEYIDAMKGWHRAIIGHNRYATVGRVTKENAHPFQSEHITGCHNGTLINHHAVLDHKKGMVVDSEMLIHTIAKRGVKEAVKWLDGAWALTWWDDKENTMNFLRNKERPLHLMITKDEKQVYWASEVWMLEGIAKRNDMKVGEVRSFAEDTHYRFEVCKDRKIKLLDKEIVKSEYKAIYTGYKYYSNKDKEKKEEVKPTGSVVPFPPKFSEEHQKAQLEVASKHPCLGIVDKFKCVGSGVDNHGASYILMESLTFPKSGYVRLNIHSKDKYQDYHNKIIKAEVHSRPFFNPVGGYAYIKAMYTTHQILKDVEKKEVVKENTEDVFLDSHGKLIPKTEWLKKHGTCAWCDGDVDPENLNNHITHNQTICGVCMQDPVISEMVH